MHSQANQQIVQQHVNRRLAGSKIGSGALNPTKKATNLGGEVLRTRENNPNAKPGDRATANVSVAGHAGSALEPIS